MWLLDLLPQYFPTARIMTYGSDTKLQGNNSTQGFFSLGGVLLSNLEFVTGDVEDEKSYNADVAPSEEPQKHVKPLIFIAHSLGGLIVKAVCTFALQRVLHPLTQKYKAIIRARMTGSRISGATYGALFYGVPNQGMETEAMCSVVKDQPNASLINSLQRDSDLLTHQTLEFDKIISYLNLDIIYFYEEKLSPQLARVSYGLSVPYDIVYMLEPAHTLIDDWLFIFIFFFLIFYIFLRCTA